MDVRVFAGPEAVGDDEAGLPLDAVDDALLVRLQRRDDRSELLELESEAQAEGGHPPDLTRENRA